MVIQPSMERLIEAVHEGTLDFTLTKPEDAQLLVSIQRVEIWNLTDIGLGSGILAVALVRLGARGCRAGGGVRRGARCGRGHRLQLLADAGHALVLVRAGGEHAADLPEHVRGRTLAGEFLSAVAAFHAHVPRSGGFRDHSARPGPGRPPDLEDPLGAGTLAALFFTASRLFWRAGIRRYSGASS